MNMPSAVHARKTPAQACAGTSHSCRLWGGGRFFAGALLGHNHLGPTRLLAITVVVGMHALSRCSKSTHATHTLLCAHTDARAGALAQRGGPPRCHTVKPHMSSTLALGPWADDQVAEHTSITISTCTDRHPSNGPVHNMAPAVLVASSAERGFPHHVCLLSAPLSL